MSIVDALQRAKLMTHDRSPGMLRPNLDEYTAVKTSGARESAPGPAARSVRQNRLRFDALRYDAAVCSQHHVMVPETDERMLQAASPSYRIMRTRILQRCRISNWSTLAITSPGPGEGKSITALNLAISLAREGNYDVFLLDLDLRNPSMCRYLGVKPKHEITDLFRGEVAAQDLFFSLSGIDRLSLAGGTVATSEASELLATGYLEELLVCIASISNNPLTLIDLPPVVNTDDALIVAPRVDATVLVVSEGRTARAGLERAVGLLADYTVAGVVLNQATESSGSEYYGA
jgi:protein-tyrosine kinase